MIENKKHKIILVGPSYPYRGGNSLFVSYLFDSLKRSFEVKLFNYKLLYPSLLFPGKTQYDKSKYIIKQTDNIRVVNSINPINWLTTALRLKKEAADLIVFDWWHPFFGPCHFAISALISRKYEGRILFITENIVSHENNIADKILTRLGLKNANLFLTLSKKVESDLRLFAVGKKIYRSELPVYDCYRSSEQPSIGREELNFDDDQKILLFFGYVRKYKGLDILIEAMSLLINDDPSFRLLIVGEFYDNKDFYIDLIKELKIEPFVELIDEFVPNEEVYKYYSVCDLVVLPYRSATQSGILNMAYGFNKPVLVTNVGGLAEFVDDNETGIIISEADPKQIRNGVIKFFELKFRIEFESNIQKRNESNSFEKISDLFESILGDIKR